MSETLLLYAPRWVDRSSVPAPRRGYHRPALRLATPAESSVSPGCMLHGVIFLCFGAQGSRAETVPRACHEHTYNPGARRRTSQRQGNPTSRLLTTFRSALVFRHGSRASYVVLCNHSRRQDARRALRPQAASQSLFYLVAVTS